MATERSSPTPPSADSTPVPRDRVDPGLPGNLETPARQPIDAEIKATSDRLQATLNAIPDLLFELDAEGRYINYHAHRLDLLAAPPEILLGKKYADVLPPDAAAVCRAAMDEAARLGRSVGAVYSLDLPQGQYWFELSIASVGARGADMRFIALARDITARKLAEQAQYRSEARWRSLADNAPYYVMVADRDLRLVYVNRVPPGLNAQHFIGKSAIAFAPSDLHSELRQRYERVLSTGAADEWELRVDADDDNARWFRVHAGPIVAEDLVESLLIVATDITEQRRSEEELRIAATAFECQEGIGIMDFQFNFLRINRAFTDITGYTSNDMLAATPIRLRSPRHPSAIYDAVRDSARRDGAWRGELWMMRKDGTDFYGRVVITAVRNARDQVSHYVANIADITHLHLEEQARRQRETLQRDALVREVHHRIKNNLQGIAGLLRQAALKHPGMDDVINQTIAQLRSIAFIHGLQSRSNAVGVQLVDLCKAIAQEVARLWQREIAVNATPELIASTLGEREAAPIALVVNELLVNAAKHSAQFASPIAMDLQRGAGNAAVQIEIVNRGRLPNGEPPTSHAQGGLQLVQALLPQEGATLRYRQQDDHVVTLLELGAALFQREDAEQKLN